MSSSAESSARRRAGESAVQSASGGGLLRIPCVRRCELLFDDVPAAAEAFLVNLNVLGAYVAHEGPARVGDLLTCRFTLPGNAIPLTPRAMVAWTNALQQHPVHSLPPGFGLRFLRLSPEHHARIAAAIRQYLRRPGAQPR